MGNQSFELAKSKQSDKDKAALFENHYCQVAERNRGHFVRYDIRTNKDDWLNKTILQSGIKSPNTSYEGPFSERICIPGITSIK